jgi:RHS repeat-associated protein
MNRKIYLIYAFQVLAFSLAFTTDAQTIITIDGPTSVCVGETKTYYTSGYGSATWSVTGGGVIIGSNVGAFVNVQWNGNGILNADQCYWIDPPPDCYYGQVQCDPDVQPPCYGEICDDLPPYQVCDHGDFSVVTNAYPPVPTITGLLSKAIPGATILTAANGASYSWLRNSVAIPGATNTQYLAVASGQYKVRSTNVATGCATESTGTTVNGNDKNFSVSNSILIPGITTEAQLHAQQLNNGANLGYVNQSVSYADDIGRPVESLQVQSSPARKDLIGFKDFDASGREAKKWLPYTSGQATGMFVAVSTAISSQTTFFTALNDKIVDDTSPFATTAFENSPLSRAIGQKGAGNYWQSNNIGTVASYGSNSASAVLIWSVDATSGLPVALNPFYYTSSALSKSVGTDEQNSNSETYADIQGRKILSRTDAGGGVWAETYYIYDGKNNLKFMLPPQLVKLLKDANSFTPTQAQIDAWAYQYNYDNLGRQIESKVPGAGWVYSVYDTRDRLVLSQDANQRANNEWSYTKYDGLDRLGESGIYRPGSTFTRQAMQDQVDAYYAANPTAIDIVLTSYVGINNYVASNSITLKPGFTFTAATSGAFSATIRNQTADNAAAAFPNENTEKLVVTFYDSYANCSFCSAPEFTFTSETWNTTSNEPFNAFYRTKDKVVASSVRILGTNNWLNTVTYYNRNGQTIQTIGSNHLGGRDRVSTLFDFSGKKLEELHTAISYNSGGIATMRKRFDYDHAGRLLKVYHKINGQNEVILSALEYNELGQVVKKKLHSEDGGTNYLQSLDYRYNIRGWLTNLNNIPSVGDTGDDGNDYFGLTMNYNNTVSGAGNSPRTDGMVSAINWKNDLSTKQRLYNFSYDNLKQLSGATHKMSGTAGNWGNEGDFFNEAGISYDLNGNIKNLNRNTEYFNGTGYTAEPIDQLTYDYGTGGNQLQFVKDNIASANKDKGFKDGGSNTVADPDYVYDANGNVIKDQNKAITSITYYFNNLPKRVTFTDGSYLENTYDAAGIKLSTVYSKSGTTVTTDYVGATVLLNGQVLVVNHEEGRITAPTYSNLMDNKDAGSTAGFPAHGGTATITSEYLNNQTYVKVVASSQNTGNMGIWPMQTTKGTTYAVKPGETYSFKVLGYQSVGTNVNLYVAKPDLTSIVWPGAQLPIGSANENWVTASFTVPAGVTQIAVGVYGATAGSVFYINKVALYKTDFEYNYFLEDQVGSPRVVLQTTPATITYMATMETENLADESTKFQNLTASNMVMSPGNSTPGGNEVIKLNALNKIGPAKSIRVYPGDKINASAMSYYVSQNGFSKTPAATMANILAPVFGGVAGAPGDPGSIFSNVGQAYGNTSTLGLSPNQGTAYPSAFLNFILFDKNYKPLDGKSVPISTEANLPKPLALPEITALEVGYVFIYLSYDNDTGGDVFFDDLKITVQESPVIQVNNYYPFGMQSYTWLREGETDNAYLYQGKELIAQTGWHDFGSRMYYADLGRWFATDPQKQFGSPYLAMGNVPMMGVDPDGEWVHILIGAVAGAIFNVATNIGNIKNAGDFFKFAGVGAAGGAVGAATGNFALAGAIVGGGNTWAQGGNAQQIIMGAGIGAIAGGIGGAAGGAVGKNLGGFSKGFVQGAVGGAVGGFTGGFLLGTYHSGDVGVGLRQGVKGGVFGAITGGIGGGIVSGLGSAFPGKGNTPKNFWTGKDVAPGRSVFAIRNIAEKYSIEFETPFVAIDQPEGGWDFTYNKTLYRGTTGSEDGNGPLFLTDEVAYASGYVKNGGQVVKVEIPMQTFQKLQQQGLIQTYRGVNNSNGMMGNEFVIYNIQLKQSIVAMFQTIK